MIELIGWFGSVLLACCGAPQAWRSWRDKHSDGLSWPFLLMWIGGEILSVVFVSTKTGVLPLLVNYYLNILFIAVMGWYKIFPQRSEK